MCNIDIYNNVVLLVLSDFGTGDTDYGGNGEDDESYGNYCYCGSVLWVNGCDFDCWNFGNTGNSGVDDRDNKD